MQTIPLPCVTSQDAELSKGTALARFWARVRINDETGCWEWTGTRLHGYGTLHVGFKRDRTNRTAFAHRLAYEYYREPLLPDLQIDHLCRNRRCCNPAHLEQVTIGENLRRGMGPTGVHLRQTHCIHGHPFTVENTRIDKDGGRSCKACTRIRQRGYDAVEAANKTHCRNGHPYTDENTGISAAGHRYCRKCRENAGRARFRK